MYGTVGPFLNSSSHEIVLCKMRVFLSITMTDRGSEGAGPLFTVMNQQVCQRRQCSLVRSIWRVPVLISRCQKPWVMRYLYG
jgi:hypothetical protein